MQPACFWSRACFTLSQLVLQIFIIVCCSSFIAHISCFIHSLQTISIISIRMVEVSIFRERFLLIHFKHDFRCHALPASTLRQIIKVIILSQFHSWSLTLSICSLILLLSDRELDVIGVQWVYFVQLLTQNRLTMKHSITLHSYLVWVVKIRLWK